MREPSNQDRYSFKAPVIFFLLLIFNPFHAFAREVRVGIYENYPKVFTTDQREPSGIFVDILESIANDEGWTLQYIHGNWAECLERLESGEIDLMMDVAYSDTRDEIYDFCDNNIVSNWAQVYTRKDLEIDILTDLEGMRISTMHGGIHLIRLEALSVFQKGDFDLVITDMAMPDVSGGELAQQIKSTSPDIPILMITGFAVLLRDKYHCQGGSAFLSGNRILSGSLGAG